MFQELDRVYYQETGPTDGGVIVADIGGTFPYVVIWDDGSKTDCYSAGQLVALGIDDVQL